MTRKQKLFIFGILLLAGGVFLGYQKSQATVISNNLNPPKCDFRGDHGKCVHSLILQFNDQYQAYQGRFEGRVQGYGSGGELTAIGCLSNGSAMWTGSCWTLYSQVIGENFADINTARSIGDNPFDDFNYWNVQFDMNDAILSSINLTVYGRRVSIRDFYAPSSVTQGTEFSVSWIVDQAYGNSEFEASSNLSCPGEGEVGASDEISCTATGSGTATVTLNAKGYGGFGVIETVSESRNISIGTQTATVACVVTDGSTNLRLSGATCSIAGQSGTTNSDGYKSFQIAIGTHTLGVTKSGYNSFSGSYVISGNTDIPVTLWRSGGGGSVSCSPSSQSTNTGVPVNFSAGGGSGTYSWSAPGGSPSTGGNSSSFTTTYSTTGTKTVTVKRGSTSDTCSVSVVSSGACTDDAAVANTTLPGSLTLNPGEIYNFSVTLRNSGTTWWYNGGTGGDWTTGYKFLPVSSFRNIIATAPDCTVGTDYGHVCPSLNVGGERTWLFNLTAPTTPGSYPFQMRMNHAPGLIPAYKNSSGSTCSGAPLAYWENYFGQTLLTTINVPVLAPTASNITVDQPDYCQVGPAATTNWTYSDPSGSPQSAYHVQIDDQGSFQTPEWDSGKIFCEGCRSNSTPQGYLSFNTTYKARVMVWNQNDSASGWTESGSFKTPLYAYPDVDFTFAPATEGQTQIVPNSPVQFTDQTVFSPQSNPQSHDWDWLFGDGGASSQQNPQHSYASENVYNVTLTATDSAGQSCSLTKPVNVQIPNPIWKEVNPGG